MPESTLGKKKYFGKSAGPRRGCQWGLRLIYVKFSVDPFLLLESGRRDDINKKKGGGNRASSSRMDRKKCMKAKWYSSESAISQWERGANGGERESTRRAFGGEPTAGAYFMGILPGDIPS